MPRKAHPNPKPKANSLDKIIGANLRRFRELRGVSQEKLAKEINLSFQQVQKYERGNNRISASRLFEVSRFLKVPITAFASEEYWDGPAIGMEECAKKVNELKKVLCDIGEMAGKARAE